MIFSCELLIEWLWTDDAWTNPPSIYTKTLFFLNCIKVSLSTFFELKNAGFSRTHQQHSLVLLVVNLYEACTTIFYVAGEKHFLILRILNKREKKIDEYL